MTSLDVSHLTVAFGDRIVIDDLSFNLKEEKFHHCLVLLVAEKPRCFV